MDFRGAGLVIGTVAMPAAMAAVALTGWACCGHSGFPLLPILFPYLVLSIPFPSTGVAIMILQYPIYGIAMEIGIRTGHGLSTFSFLLAFHLLLAGFFYLD